MPNQAPTHLTLNNSAISRTIQEGETIVIDFISQDPVTGKTFTYELVSGDGDTDNSLFTIVDNQLIANTVLDFESLQTSYSIRVKTTDQDRLSSQQQYNINVNDINEAPTDLSYDNTTDTTAIDEGQTDVRVNLISTDQDTGSIFTYSLVTGDGDTDNSLFSIVDNQLIANIVFDFETKDSYSIRVQTTDQGGLSFEKQLNITVTNVNEAVPVITSAATATFAENGTGTVYTVIATDADAGTTLTYSLSGTDANLFNINSSDGVVTFKDAPNFELPSDNGANNIYDINVIVNDGTVDTVKAVAIEVTNVNDAPTNLTLSTSTVEENGQTDGVIGNLSSTDPDTGNTFTYSLVTGDGDTDNSLFSIVDNQLIALTVFDYETQTSYSIRVKTEDQDGLSFEKQLNINVNDINEAPTDLLLDNTAIAEGQPIGAVIGNLTSTDQDTGNTFTYSLVTGTGATDNSLFTITNNQLKTNAVFDFETQTIYSIRVKTEDQDGLSFERQLNINVNDINEAPTDLLLDNTAIAEGQTDGVIGNLISIDPDTGNTFTYSLVTGTGDTENSLFSIVDNQLIANTVFDFETQTIYSIRVKTEDQDGLSFERQLNINVNDINEAPTDLSYDNTTDTTTIDERKPIGTVVGNLSSTDPDTGNTFTYSLVTGDGATDNSLFTITGNQLKTNSVLDYETKNSYRIRVKTRDQGGLSFEKQLTIGVTDVPEPPTLNRPSSGNTFVIKGDNNDKKRLEVKLTGYNSKLNSELGVFTVDDADGKIDGIAPGAAGYTDKALQRGQVIFSLLGNSPVGFDQSRLSRLLEFNSNSNLRFYLVKDGSTDSVLNNTTPKTNVLFDISSNVTTTTSGNGFSLAWEDGSGNRTGFEDLRVTITPTDRPVAPGTSVQNKSQGVKGEKELLDLRGINGPVKADFVVNREAAYNNFVGFYKVNDENGGIDTDGNGTIDVRPGATGYAQAALKARVSDLALAVNNNGTANFNNKTLQGGSFFAPFIITNGGTPDNYDNINSRIYFTFGAANSDGVDHVRLLGDNTFGFEDLAGGGDKDFNDVIVKVTLTV
jgi:predicted protein tyrosine phosphatase